MFIELFLICNFCIICDYNFFFIPDIICGTFSFFLYQFYQRFVKFFSLSQIQCLACLVLFNVSLFSVLLFFLLFYYYFSSILFFTLSCCSLSNFFILHISNYFLFLSLSFFKCRLHTQHGGQCRA